jgi:glyoxalase family protein
MDQRILGLHHITAIAGDAKKNFNFYANVLGLRMVKKTVNFDDPGTYHFYFGDETGNPGSILTFFPWEGIQQGRPGSGQSTEISYAMPQESLEFWTTRLKQFGTKITGQGKRFGEDYLAFEDPDGLPLTFLIPSAQDRRNGWTTPEVNATVAAKGFHSATLTLRKKEQTVKVLELLGYRFVGEEAGRFRYATDAIETASVIDIIEKDSEGISGAGTIHHIAFRVKDETTQMNFREKITKAGYQITPKIDRNYFFSLYFREPGGVLFEIATDNPGFTVDEELKSLGTTLKLPQQYESHRAEIEKVLPVLL